MPTPAMLGGPNGGIAAPIPPGWTPPATPAPIPAAPAASTGDALTQYLQQFMDQNTAATNTQMAANQQALQAGYQQQAADLGLQQQQAISGAQTQVGQLVPQIANLQSALSLQNAQANQAGLFTGARDQNAMAGRGLATSGIALGVTGRDALNLQNKIASQNLASTQQQDALSRQITGLQQTTAQNVAGLQSRINVLNQAAHAAAPGGSV